MINIYFFKLKKIVDLTLVIKIPKHDAFVQVFIDFYRLQFHIAVCAENTVDGWQSCDQAAWDNQFH